MMALNRRRPVAGFSRANCAAMAALVAPFLRPSAIVPVWKHCR